jgi:hypothetical protein
MWLEQLILTKAEKRLSLYRIEARSLRNKMATEYEYYLPQISCLYQKATHWHGTGRYHYEHQNGSRYIGVSEELVTDILIAILDSGGLEPHLDPWIDSGNKTVSLATVRMHARAFARIHLFEKDVLLYELGSIKFWIRLYFLLLFLWLCSNFRSHFPFIKSLFRSSFFKDIKAYSNTIRRPKRNKSVGIFSIFGKEIPVSDIPGNYPILIGVVVPSKDLIDTIPLTHKVEQRSLKQIALSQCTHIEVPFKNLKEIQKLLKEKGVSIPVIPLEFGDLYLNDQPLERLAFLE